MFAQEFMNQPVPPEGMELKEKWLQFFEHLPLDSSLKYYMGVDPSSGKRGIKGDSHYAHCVVAHDFNFNKIYIVEFFRGKLSKEQQVKKAIETASKYHMEAMYVESVFEYTHVYNALRQRFINVHDKDYIHTRLKGVSAVAKEERIREVVGPACEIGRLYFRQPNLDPQTKEFIDHEYIPFPLGAMDMLDSLVLAIHSLTTTEQITEIPWYFPS